MGSAETHLGKAGCEPRPCQTCGTIYTPRRAWATFCSTKCRNDYHAEERRKDMMRAAAPELYAALLELRKAIHDYGGHGMPGFKDRAIAYQAMQDADVALGKAGYKEPKPKPVALAEEAVKA